MTSFQTLMWLVRIISEPIFKLNVACLKCFTAISTFNPIFLENFIYFYYSHILLPTFLNIELFCTLTILYAQLETLLFRDMNLISLNILSMTSCIIYYIKEC